MFGKHARDFGEKVMRLNGLPFVGHRSDICELEKIRHAFLIGSMQQVYGCFTDAEIISVCEFRRLLFHDLLNHTYEACERYAFGFFSQSLLSFDQVF
jgi:hypothetical protein